MTLRIWATATARNRGAQHEHDNAFHPGRHAGDDSRPGLNWSGLRQEAERLADLADDVDAERLQGGADHHDHADDDGAVHHDFGDRLTGFGIDGLMPAADPVTALWDAGGLHVEGPGVGPMRNAMAVTTIRRRGRRRVATPTWKAPGSSLVVPRTRTRTPPTLGGLGWLACPPVGGTNGNGRSRISDRTRLRAGRRQ